MKIHEYNEMMAYMLRPAQQAKLVDDLEPGSLKDELLKDFDPSQETYEEYLRRKSVRETAAQGGVIGKDGMFQGEDMGTREGFRKPTSVQKMSVSDALEEIFDLGSDTPKTQFLDREELKKLVEEKIGTKINKNILKTSRYPILNYVEYNTSKLMKEKAAANKKENKLTKKEASAQAKIKKQNRINLFKENLGVDIEIGRNNEIIGLDEELDKRLRNASKRFRENKLNTAGISAYDDPNFFQYFDTEYRTADDRLKATAEKYGYTLDEWGDLSENQKKRIYAQEFQNKVRINKGEVPAGLSLEEIVEEAYKGKKIPGKGPASKVLDTVYETLFRQEYDKLAEGGNPFSKADLSKNVVVRMKEMFGRPGQEFPLQLLPAGTDIVDSKSAKSYYQYIDPKTQRGSVKSKIFSDYELELFDGNTASSLNKTKTQEKLFDIITEGPVEIDDLSKQLEMTPNKIRSEINKLLTNVIVRPTTPIFLKGKQNLFSDLINNLEASKTLDQDWNRSLKYIIYSQIPDPKAQKLAFDKIDEFDATLKTIQEKFPGVQINYDHPASYTALKNQNFKQFLNVTPIAKDINILKATFDSRSNQNLLAMNEARAAGNNNLFNEYLNKQTKLEDTWSKLTGGKSSLGKIRLEGVEDFGTLRLDDPKKDLFGEFQDNIKIRQNISKNLTDDIKKDIIDVLPRKDRETSVIKTLENITNPDLIKQDRQLQKLLMQMASKGGAKGKAAVRALQIIAAGGVGYKMEDILKGTGLMNKKYELTASAADAPLVEKGLSTGEKVATGTAAAGTLGTKTGRKILGKGLNLALGPTGMVGLNVALGTDPTETLDRVGLETEAAFAPSLVKGVTSMTDKIKNPMLRKVAERATLAGMSPAMAMRVARVASPLGIASLGLEGLYQYGKFAKDEIAKVKAMSPEERDFYNDLLMDEGGLLD